MAKRVGKSGSRRGRKARRPASRPVPSSAAPAPTVEREASASVRPTPPAAPARSVTPGLPSTSRLGERAAAEYHYVARDLRNIGILVVVMAALLAAATIAFSALGIGPG